MSAHQIQQVQYRHRLDFLSTIDVAALAQCIQSGSTVVIDSRQAPDYRAAHIPGAFNLPVSLRERDVRARMDGISIATPLVIYCQSMGCDFDEQMAMRLLDIGYQDITLFAGGWVAWQDYASTHELDLTTEKLSGE
jgi:rhodanese-related sulfurtransferase